MSEPSIADLYRAVEILNSANLKTELERLRRENHFEPSLQEMADAIGSKLLDLVLYEGQFAVFQRQQLSKRLKERRAQ